MEFSVEKILGKYYKNPQGSTYVETTPLLYYIILHAWLQAKVVKSEIKTESATRFILSCKTYTRILNQTRYSQKKQQENKRLFYKA